MIVNCCGKDALRCDCAEWEHSYGVTCVVCPVCAFTFDEVHTDADGGYSCPACAELSHSSPEGGSDA